MNIGLIGKKYIDSILYTDGLDLGETNKALSYETRLGGMYNIPPIEGVDPIYYPIGEKYATIISEPSRRTSIVQDGDLSLCSLLELDKLEIGLFGEGDEDWYHIMYIDDIDFSIQTNNQRMSIDFCTLDERSKYSEAIDNSQIIFDSRERRYLYDNILSETPLILHDENGCECIILGKSCYKSSIEPIKGLHVNGAGDIFSAVFIKNYLSDGLRKAISNSSQETTEILKGKTNEEV